MDLTDEQVQHYVDLACAIEGVPFLPPEPTKPAAPAAEPDRAIYVVLGIDFADHLDAQRVADVLLDCEVLTRKYLPGAGYQHQTVERVDDTEITVGSARVFSREHWDRVRDEVQKYGQEEEEYQADMQEYREASARRSEASEAIYERISEVHEKHYRRQTLQAAYDRYLDLADGDAAVASRFLANAHHDAQDLLPELFVFAAEDVEAEPVAY